MSCNQEEWCRSGVNGGVTIIRVTAASSTQRYYIVGGSEGKDRKTWKSRSEVKVVGFSSGSLFSTRKWEAVTQGETI